MITRTLKTTLALVAAGAIAACGGSSLDASSDAAKGKQEPKLNLSHIMCVEDGTKVEVHFVLLFWAGTTPPPDLYFTWNDGTADHDEIVEAGPNTGNVWHYTTYLDPGYINVVSAYIDSTPPVDLHNPSEYAGDYTCNEEPVCDLTHVQEGPRCVKTSTWGSPERECGAFGLVPLGKKDGLTGTTYVADRDADLAIVKSGSGGCDGKGESAYNIYVDVKKDDELATPFDQAISHVTYCACPPE